MYGYTRDEIKTNVESLINDGLWNGNIDDYYAELNIDELKKVSQYAIIAKRDIMDEEELFMLYGAQYWMDKLKR